jgi:CotH kinase protein
MCSIVLQRSGNRGEGVMSMNDGSVVARRAPFARTLPGRRCLGWLLAVLAATLVACGGGSDGDSPTVAESAAPAEARPLTLATLDINTAGQPVALGTYIAASYVVSDANGATLHQGPIEIRGRGNSTWSLDKKPYRVRLGDAQALLGMPSSRHWVLLANHADKTLLRNDVTFELGRSLGMAWTPRSRDVQVRLNGRYDGVYQLVEHIRIASDRVNIDELEPEITAGAAITGGYLLQIDELSRGNARCFTTRIAQMTVCGEDPEELEVLPAQRNYIAGYVQTAEDALYGAEFASPTRGYAAHIDVDSAIQYYLASELVKNVDGNLRRSTYLWKPRGGKLHFGPLWDFDLAIGNAAYFGATDAQGWYIRSAPWFTRMFEDPRFADRVAATWREMKRDGRLDALLAHVDRRATELRDAQARNFERWPILDVNVFANVAWPFPNSYDNEVAYLRRFLVERMAWMDAQWAPP